MPEKNIYKLDNVLIPAGWILLLVWLTAASAHVDFSIGGIVLLLVDISPVMMLIIGYLLRAKEKKYIALWRLLDRTARISVNELVQSTNFNAEEIREGLRTINSTGRAFFVWESHSGNIINSRFQNSPEATINCPNCGASNNKRLFPNSSSTVCDYCGETFTHDSVEQPQPAAAGQVVAHQQPATSQMQSGVAPSEFKMSTFLMLCFFFWPAAVVYFLRCK